ICESRFGQELIVGHLGAEKRVEEVIARHVSVEIKDVRDARENDVAGPGVLHDITSDAAIIIAIGVQPSHHFWRVAGDRKLIGLEDGFVALNEKQREQDEPGGMSGETPDARISGALGQRQNPVIKHYRGRDSAHDYQWLKIIAIARGKGGEEIGGKGPQGSEQDDDVAKPQVFPAEGQTEEDYDREKDMI